MKFQLAINLERLDDSIDMRDVARHKELVPVRASAAASATPRRSERASKSPLAQHPVHLVSSSTRIFIQQQPKQQHLNDWVQHHEQPPLKHIETEQKQEARLEGSRASVSRSTKASADEELPPPPAAAAEKGQAGEESLREPDDRVRVPDAFLKICMMGCVRARDAAPVMHLNFHAEFHLHVCL